MQSSNTAPIASLSQQAGDKSHVYPLGLLLYMNSRLLRVDHYKLLMDRGWRRSGKLLYKPDQTHSCCPHYTIRLHASSFAPRRDHRQAIHRWNRHILGDAYISALAKLKPVSKADKAATKSTFNLEKEVHAAEYDNLPVNDAIIDDEHKEKKKMPEPTHKFTVTLEPDDYTDEKFELYKRYQIHVHKESESETKPKGFRNFLCDSPLIRVARPEGDKYPSYGSYHLMYRVSGKLIGISVIDILPSCLSSVYFIYDPEYEAFSLGKVSAVREILLAKELDLEYYYMGYWIPRCAKMRYKFDYRPTEVLDYGDWGWKVIGEKERKILDEAHWVTNFPTTEDGEPLTFPRSEMSPEDMEMKHDAGSSLWDLEFDGLMSEEEVEKIDFGKMGIVLDIADDGEEESMAIFPVTMLVGWVKGSSQTPGFRRVLVELAACTGREVAEALLIDDRSRSA